MIIDERQSLGELGNWISNAVASASALYNQGIYTPAPGMTSCERNRLRGYRVVCRDKRPTGKREEVLTAANAAKLEQEKLRLRYAAMIAQAQDEANSRGGCGISRTSSMPGGNGYHVITQHR
jgi:hypothetical protein